jgi:choline dehydrogenase
MSVMASRTDVLVLGGGTAGCVIASRLSEAGGRTVRLVEAGPDYGPFEGGRWPHDLLDGGEIATSHGWAFNHGEDDASRARVIGGCSSHNACMVVWPAESDLAGWVEATGDPRWAWPAFARRLAGAQATFGTRSPGPEEHAALGDSLLAAGEASGLPVLADFNARPSAPGIGRVPVNAVGDTRWNASFAYLDPARGRPSLEVLGDTLVDRVVIRDGRAVGAVVRSGGSETVLEAATVILAGGAYGSPAVLMRSGLGPRTELEQAGIGVIRDMPGVGARLRDHPGVVLVQALTPEATARVRERAVQSRMDIVLARARSSASRPDAFDLHVLLFAAAGADDEPGTLISVVWLMAPSSTGDVRLVSSDPDTLPEIHHGLLTDPAGEDLERLADGVGVVRRILAQPPLSAALGDPIGTPPPNDRAGIEAWVAANRGGYWHPVGTCSMGRADDPMAVVDGAGRVQGVAGLLVADASIMPSIPRANTNLATAALAETIAAGLAGSST